MKKFIFLFILSSLIFSCDIESDSPNFSFEIVGIDSVETPELFIFAETYEISVTYIAPNGCYEFNDFIYDINGNERTIAVVNTVYDYSNCTTAEESITVSFNFTVTSTETYLFRFYKGENEEGADEYHLVEIPVEMGD
ncbi:hypothetical protein [Winogradskyella aurantia]|uniref:Uncharacterized protein n=1 Tax=Winogradskyella aurantia TaxID=1915063 RepID=A0A265UZN8_9FLAO|nr:hypothetical protein [Winogradskyella aurantia]OZV70770.1 hypothetical protein CA834_01265 [Winogradskyella aurantia]